MATLDHRGRIADLGLVRAMGWSSVIRLDIRERGGLLLVTASPQGVFSLTAQGHLRLPTTVRRWCGLGTGDRVLLAAQPEAGAVARAYAGHTDSGGQSGATHTYVRASVQEVAGALAALTGEPHPLADAPGSRP